MLEYGVLKRWKIILPIIVVIAGLIFWRVKAAQNKDVEKTTVEKGTVREELVLSGEIDAEEYAGLGFSSSGKLIKVNVGEGDEVKKGQALASIDATSFSNDLLIADADLRAKAASLDVVYDDLQGQANDEDFEEKETRTLAETAKDKAVFTHIKAQNILSNATLRAPFDGFVTYVANPFAGVNVLSTEKQIEVVNPQTIYFDVVADQTEVYKINKGQKVVVALDSFVDEELEGKVEFVSFAPKPGESGAVYKVKVKFVSNVDLSKVRIGMTGDAKFVLDQKEDVLFIPNRFLNTDRDGRFVNLSKKNNKVYVEVGLEGEDQIEITSGLSEGDTVFR